MDLGCYDDDHHDRDDQVCMQAGERDDSASEPLSPGSELQTTFITTAYDTRNYSTDIMAGETSEVAMAGRLNSNRIPKSLYYRCLASCEMLCFKIDEISNYSDFDTLSHASISTFSDKWGIILRSIVKT